MKYKLPNAYDRAIVTAVEKAMDDLKKRGAGPSKRATLTGESVCNDCYFYNMFGRYCCHKRKAKERHNGHDGACELFTPQH